MRWWRLVLGLVLLGSALFVLVTAWSPVVHGDPVYPVTLAVTAGAGLLMVLSSRPDPHDPAGTRPRRSPWLVVPLRVLQVVVVGGLAATLVWLRPFAATPEAVAAMSGGSGVTVTDTATRIVLTPGSPTGGLVFYPGARVDARAYVPLLRRLAEQGTEVTVVKEPFGIAFLSAGAAGRVAAERPELVWTAGGHSLGGVVAASDAGDPRQDVRGLLLWASYPVSSIADAPLSAMSVSGSKDGFTTPADVAASKPDLPPGTEFVVVDGAVHSFFGDYGQQPGDGTPTIPRADAQAQIVAASGRLLRQVAAVPAG